MPPLPSPTAEVWATHFAVPPSNVLYTDDDLVVFPDHVPRAATHLLLVPRYRFIRGVEDLTAADVPLLLKMARLAAQHTASPPIMGFHQWPLRSVHHLHLHCLVPPFKPARQKWRYTELLPNCSSFGFISLSSVLSRLLPPPPLEPPHPSPLTRSPPGP